MSVHRRLLAVLFLVAALALIVVATPAGAQSEPTTKCTAYTVLKAGNEVPPSGSKAFGAAAVHINGTTLSFAVTIVNPAREVFFAGHIHDGDAGANGPVVVTLFGGPDTDRKLIVQAARMEIDATTASNICADVDGFYVNYHTRTFPGGAIRGQLTPVD
ncbi:MAG: CHRD domain-containing protein [Gaiellaceae bacterium]